MGMSVDYRHNVGNWVSKGIWDQVSERSKEINRLIPLTILYFLRYSLTDTYKDIKTT